MNISAKIDFSGLDEALTDQLNARMELIEENLSDAADVVLNAAKTSKAFKDKIGNLRKSIKKRKSKFPDGGYIVFAGRGTKGKGNHAHLVEFGHIASNGVRVAPRPFLRQALEKGISFLRAKVSS